MIQDSSLALHHHAYSILNVVVCVCNNSPCGKMILDIKRVIGIKRSLKAEILLWPFFVNELFKLLDSVVPIPILVSEGAPIRH